MAENLVLSENNDLNIIIIIIIIIITSISSSSSSRSSSKFHFSAPKISAVYYNLPPETQLKNLYFQRI